MKKNKILSIITMVILLFSCSANFAVAKKYDKLNVAIVDVQRIVASSGQINALKQDQNKKISELKNFVDNAKTNLAKETNETKRISMEDSYNRELNSKKEAIDKEYSQKLLGIEKDINEIIGKKAKKLGYDLVLTKNSTLFGGTDITNEITKAIK